MPDVWREHLVLQDRVTAWEDADIRRLGVDFDNARRVIDLGTGYGDYLAGLSQEFPSCSFLGVDNDETAIAAASTGNHAARVSYETADVEAEGATFSVSDNDIAIARLLVQHLHHPDQFAENAFRHLRSGGHLVVIEAYEPFKRVQPRMPCYSEIFRDLRDRQDRAKDGSLLQFHEVLRRAGFELVAERVLAGYTGVHFTSEDFAAMCRTNLAVVRDHLGGRGDFRTAFSEIDDWLGAPDRFASIGMFILVAKR